MPDHYIKGRSPTYRLGSGTAGGLLSSRFVVQLTGTQTLDGDESAVVHWDELDGGDPRQWDQIGFPGDYFAGSFEFFPPVAGYYHITAYVQFAAQTAWTTGTVVAHLDTPEQPQEAQSAQCTPDRGAADVALSGTHYFDPDLGDGVTVAIDTSGVDDNVVITKASISFIKVG